MPLDSQGSDVLDLWQRGAYQNWPLLPPSQQLQHQPQDRQIEEERLRSSTQTSSASQTSLATVQPSIGDGNCFFRFCSFFPQFLEPLFFSSIVIALFGSDSEYAQFKLREEVIDRLEKLWKTGSRQIRDFIDSHWEHHPSYTSFSEYLVQFLFLFFSFCPIFLFYSMEWHKLRAATRTNVVGVICSWALLWLILFSVLLLLLCPIWKMVQKLLSHSYLALNMENFLLFVFFSVCFLRVNV